MPIGTTPIDMALFKGSEAAAPVGGGGGPTVGDGLMLEDGTSFLLLETGDFLLLEG